MSEERRTKHERVAGWLEGRGLDGVVLTRRCNFSWYTCGAHNHVAEACDVGVSSLVATRDGAVVVANNIEATRLLGEDLPADIEVIQYPYHDPAGRLDAFARAMARGRFAGDTPLEPLPLQPTDEPFDRLRWQLTAAELQRYRALCRDVAECVEDATRALAPGMTEAAIAAALAAELRRRQIVPWVLLVGCDERIVSHRHPLPTGKPLETMAMLVTTAERGGLQVAVTRLVAFGKVSADLTRRHRAVTMVDAALIASTRPGQALGEIFAAAQQAYAEAGFADEWRRHHQGGSIGYLPREVKAGPRCHVRALADQAFAWNPSIAGTKSEDTILCTPAGPEILTHTGRWPTRQAAWRGQTLHRPDILVL